MHVSDAVGSVERQLKDDIMAGLPQCGVEFYTHKHIDPPTFDAFDTQYYKDNQAGIDVSTLTVWNYGSGTRPPGIAARVRRPN